MRESEGKKVVSSSALRSHRLDSCSFRTMRGLTYVRAQECSSPSFTLLTLQLLKPKRRHAGM